MDSTTPAKPRPSELVPIGVLVPSKTNPRSRFDEASLKELAASMAPPVGIIEPLIVRALDTMQAVLNHPEEAARNGAKFEIVAGERRWRAAKMAGLTEVPIIVRDLTDTQVLSLQVIENHQRADVHPLDEAHAIERWMKLDRTVTTKSIAAAIGVSERTVQNKLRYLTLTPEARKEFLTDAFSAGHADLLIRLSPADQALALKDGLFSTAFDTGEDNDFFGGNLTDGGKTVTRLRSVREFDIWLKENVRLKPDEAAQSGLFPELAQAVADVLKPATDGSTVATLFEIVNTYHYTPRKGDKGPHPLDHNKWKEVKPSEKACHTRERGVIVMGKDQGRVLTICVDKTCKVHWPHSELQPGYGPDRATPSKPRKKQKWEIDAEKQRVKDRERQQLWEEAQKPILAALDRAARKAKPTPATVQLLASYGNKATTFADLVAQHVQDEIYGLGEAEVVAKALGVDLKPILAAAAPKPAAAAPKPKKQKPARAFVKKGARAGVVKALAKKGGKKR